jgi:hypothetical protein
VRYPLRDAGRLIVTAPVVTFTTEQFDALLKKLAPGADKAPGVGAPRSSGLGCSGGPLDAGVYAMLAAGSPRLALAKAWGIPLAPYLINVIATFANTATTDVLDVGSDVKIVQDTLVDALVVRIQNMGTTANQNQFQTLSDFFFNFQSSIQAKLDVQGAPRYSVAPKFTPLSTIADVINGQSHWPGGWILTYQQQLFMSFHADVQLPDAPMKVACTYRGWVPVNEMFTDMKNADAISYLLAMGYDIPTGMQAALLGRSPPPPPVSQ